MKNTLLFIFIALFLAADSPVFAQYITTFAGTGSAGFSGDAGPAQSAQLNAPVAVAFSPSSGNLYIADANNNRVRMVNASSGVITTIAGNGTAGSAGDGGQATAANLNGPSGLAFDLSGNLYIADRYNHRIRMVNATTGVISTYAGTGAIGNTGDTGPATAARFNNPVSVAIDPPNYLYISDQNNNRVRRVNMSTGVINAFAGTGAGGYTGDGGNATAATLRSPAGIRVDGSSNVYIADYFNHAIRMVNTSNIISTIAGTGTLGYSGDGGQATAARLNFPSDIDFDATGNIFIADFSNHAIRRVDLGTSVITSYIGTGSAGFNASCTTDTNTLLNQPAALTFDASGVIYIADRANERIRYHKTACSGTPAGGTATASATDGCGSYSTNLALIGAAAGCDIAYQWQTSTDGTTYTNISGATNLTYTLSVTSSVYVRAVVTCTASGTFYAGSPLYLRVSVLPRVGPVVGATSVCVGGTTTYTDTSTLGSWYVTNGNASVTSGGVLTGIFAGIDTVIYRTTNICGSAADSEFVTIRPILPPSVALSYTPSTTICTGTRVTFIATPTMGGSAPSYIWNVNGSTSGTTDTFRYTPSNNDTVAVVLTSNDACASTRTGARGVRMSIIARVVPTISVSDAPRGDSVCLGETVNYTTSVTFAGTSPTYQWSVNGINISGATSSTFSRIPANADVITCTLTSSQNCATPSTASASRTMVVTASQTPDVAIMSNTGSDTTCAGFNTTYSTNYHYGGSTPNLRWKKNGIYTATGPAYTFYPAFGDSIQCVLFSNSPCRTADSVFSNVIRPVVIPTVTTSATIAAAPGTTIVAGTTVTFLCTAVNVGSSPTYQWVLNGAAVTGATTALYVTSTLANGDRVYCRVTTPALCATPNPVTSNALTITINTVSLVNVEDKFTVASIAPNPNTGTFQVAGMLSGNASEVAYTLYNLTGVACYTQSETATAGDFHHSLQLPATLPAGVYMLKVAYGTQQQMLRVVVAR